MKRIFAMTAAGALVLAAASTASAQISFSFGNTGNGVSIGQPQQGYYGTPYGAYGTPSGISSPYANVSPYAGYQSYQYGTSSPYARYGVASPYSATAQPVANYYSTGYRGVSNPSYTTTSYAYPSQADYTSGISNLYSSGGYPYANNGYPYANTGYVNNGYPYANNGYVNGGYPYANNGYQRQGGYPYANNGYQRQGVQLYRNGNFSINLSPR